MKKIRVGDFKLGNEEKEAINGVLNSGKLSEGIKVNEFEKKWAEFVGTRYCITTSSGTAALIAGLTALKYYKGLEIGAKVITTPLTYIATSSAVSNAGFEPVYVDVDSKTFDILPEEIESLLEHAEDPEKYVIILPVHLMGYPARMDEINRIAKEYSLTTFEDSAQAHGTVYKDKRCGSMSTLAAFSFYIAHNIQAGEMGAINTDDSDINRLVRKLKSQGRLCDCSICTRSSGECPKIKAYQGDDDFDPRFTHELIGYNFKTMEFQAALALSQLDKVDWIVKKRQKNVRYLNERLEKYNDILQLPAYSDKVSYLAYPLVVKSRISRKWLRNQLEKNGVETRPLFGCIPTQQPAYAHLKKEYLFNLPNAEYLGRNGFYIGCHQYLDEEDLDYVVSVFDKVLKGTRVALQAYIGPGIGYVPLAEKQITASNKSSSTGKTIEKKVSIVIVNWNGQKRTLSCLESLGKISYFNVEVVVVDNHSSDDSVEILKKKFPEVTLIENVENAGFAEGANIGARYALEKDANYILFLNNDVVVDEFFLKELVKFAESDERVGIVGPKIYLYDRPNKIWSVGIKIDLPEVRNIGAKEEDSGQFGKNQKVSAVTGCALLVKTEVLNRIGLFDQSLFMIHEDLDLCIRAGKMGYSCYSVPSAMVWHKASSSIRKRAEPFGMYYFYRNWFLVVKKHFGRRVFIRTLLAHIFRIFPRQIKWSMDNYELTFRLIGGYVHTILDSVLGRTVKRYL